MEPTSAVCFGGGRRRVGPSPSVETEKQRHLGSDFGQPHPSRELAVLDRGLPQCHHRALGHLRATSSNAGGSLRAAPMAGGPCCSGQESQRGVSTRCSPSPPPQARCWDTEVLHKVFTMQQSCWQPGTRANPTITNQGVSQRQKTTR